MDSYEEADPSAVAKAGGDSHWLSALERFIWLLKTGLMHREAPTAVEPGQLTEKEAEHRRAVAEKLLDTVGVAATAAETLVHNLDSEPVWPDHLKADYLADTAANVDATLRSLPSLIRHLQDARVRARERDGVMYRAVS